MGEQHEPIAIIGMGLRLPGGVDEPSKLWQALIEKRSTQSKIPHSRFNKDAFVSQSANPAPGTMPMDGGYFLSEELADFENAFFRINNVEATSMDPEQRKLLEVVYECVDDAGVSLDQLSGSSTGCFVGNFTYDFQALQNRDLDHIDRYAVTGMGNTILSNRISHTFDLKGPSLTLDTACSASLYGLHLACAALRDQDCSAAIVAAANLIQSPEQFLGTAKAGVLSPTSTCHTFDASADGYGRGEAINALYLKRLSTAIADGDPVRAVVVGTAANSNGRTPGITQPSHDGQVAVIQHAYRQAGLDTSETQYVECHGTGTAVGDPIEVEALASAMGSRNRDSILVGSNKPNFGHSETASGLTSIMKVTLALEHGIIPPTRGISMINPRLRLDDWKVEIVQQSKPWPAHGTRRRAGVNSFGYGGANSHAILEAAEHHLPDGYQASRTPDKAPSSYIVPLSASNETSLRARLGALSKLAGWNMSEVVTSAASKSVLECRGVVTASAIEELRDDNLSTLPKTTSKSTDEPIFVFTGQGAQWLGMGRELMAENFHFTACIEQLDAVLQRIPHAPGWTLKDLLQSESDDSRVHEVDISQPLCTAVQICLVNLLQACGISPASVIGHSSGEIAAAYTAGQLSQEQAIVVAYYRGFVCAGVSRPGAMLASGISSEEADALIEDLGLSQKVRVACYNAPENVTISGDLEAIHQIEEVVRGQDKLARILKTGGRAYHSHHMEEVASEYERLVLDIWDYLSKPSTNAKATWVSSVWNRPMTRLLPSYWIENLISPVRFRDAVGITCEERQNALWIEIGPHNALESPTTQSAEAASPRCQNTYLTVLRRAKSGLTTFHQLIAQLYLSGFGINFNAANGLKMAKSRQHCRPGFPKYQWTYKKALTNISQAAKDHCQRQYPPHELLGTEVLKSDGATAIWRKRLHADSVGWLSGHRLEDTIVFPAAGYIAMVTEAVRQLCGSPFYGVEIRDMKVSKALVVPSDKSVPAIDVRTTLWELESQVKHGNTSYGFRVGSRATDIFLVHAEGQIQLISDPTPYEPLGREQLELEESAPRSWYKRFNDLGLDFSGDFRSMSRIWTPRRRDLEIAKVHLQPQTQKNDNHHTYIIHPVDIDSVLQSGLVATSKGFVKGAKGIIPVEFKSLRLRKPAEQGTGIPSNIWKCFAKAKTVGFNRISLDASLTDEVGQVVIRLGGCVTAPLQSPEALQLQLPRQPMLRIEWKPDFAAMLRSMPADFSKYVGSSTAHHMLAVVDLLAHKSPQSRILFLGDGDPELISRARNLLRNNPSFERCSLIHSGKLLQDGRTVRIAVHGEADKSELSGNYQYDLVVMTAAEDLYTKLFLPAVESLLAIGGSIVMTHSRHRVQRLETDGFECIVKRTLDQGSAKFVLARKADVKVEKKASLQGCQIYVVTRDDDDSVFWKVRTQLLRKHVRTVRQIRLSEVMKFSFPSHCIIISLLEAENALLKSISPSDLRSVQTMIETAATLMWITRGSLLDGGDPDFAPVAGLARTIHLEQPGTKFVTFDLHHFNDYVLGSDDRLLALSQSLSASRLRSKSSTYSLVENVAGEAPVYASSTEEDAGSLSLAHDSASTRSSDSLVQPDGKFTISQEDHAMSSMVSILDAVHGGHEDDREFILNDGVVFTSRFVPETALNASFRHKQVLEPGPTKVCTDTMIRVSIPDINLIETLTYVQEEPIATVQSNEILIQLQESTYGPKDAAILSGQRLSRNGKLGFIHLGNASKVGSEVTNIVQDDRVLVVGALPLTNQSVVPDWRCCTIRDHGLRIDLLEDYMTAIYAAQLCANLGAQDVVYIDVGRPTEESLALAIIQVATTLNASVVLNTQYTKSAFSLLELDTELMTVQFSDKVDIKAIPFQLPAFDTIFQLSQSLPDGVTERLVDNGKIVNLSGHTVCNMENLKNIQQLQIDMRSLLSDSANPKQRIILRRLIQQSLHLSRDLARRPTVPERFGFARYGEALRYLGQEMSTNPRISLDYTDPTPIPVTPLKYDTSLSNSKWYFLVGCLGGLGRAMARWMFSRGARKFIFMGPSGASRPEAREFVAFLEADGAHVKVHKGDVSDRAEVVSAMGLADGRIGGVIHAAMGLDEALFSQMTADQWNKSVKPKLFGAWNIHHALSARGFEGLDFLLFTSSLTGSVGVATESNYCAANAFLDNFVRFLCNGERNGYGKRLPATAVGLGMISQVGYLHDHEDIEELLVRKGVQAIDEDEFLQIIDLAISTAGSETRGTDSTDKFCSSHMVTGLEPLGYLELLKRGYKSVPTTFDDPRAKLLSKIFDDPSSNTISGEAESSGVLSANDPEHVKREKITALLRQNMSNYLLVPEAELDFSLPLANYGIDSMLASAMRLWMHRTFSVLVPFMEFSSATKSFDGLVEDFVAAIQ